MSRSKIRWGILGVAKINERILPSFARAENAELVAIASRSLERAQEAAHRSNIPRAYGSYEQLLKDRDIDVVYNPLPNTLHAEWTMKAADQGKHILCEKPLAVTADEAQKMVDHCAAQGVQLMDGFMWPHHPRTAKLRESLDKGVIGEVRRVTAAFTFKMEKLDPANIRLKPELGGGSLLDVGCYPVFGIRWIFGAEPVKVFAQARYEYGVDVEMTGMMWFADGRMASFDCGFTLPLRMGVEIAGSDGVITLSDLWLPPHAASFHIRKPGQPEADTVTVAGEDQIAHMLRNFSRAVQAGEPVKQAPTEGVKTLRVLEALGKSARTGQVEVVK
jgi:xylose dehydrogenase (NAD/NADP)